MSNIQSITGGASLDTQFLQQLQRRNPAGGEGFAARFESRIGDAAKAAGVDEAEIPDLIQEIRDAVNSLETDPASGDRRSKIREAVDSILDEHGIDPESLREHLKPQGSSDGVSSLLESLQGSTDPSAILAALRERIGGDGSFVNVVA